MSGVNMLLAGDCLDVLPSLAAGTIDACITDPPYGIGAPGTGGWDRELPAPAVWGAVRRVLRPGAGVAVMAARRLYHRLAVMLEDQGYTVDEVLA